MTSGKWSDIGGLLGGYRRETVRRRDVPMGKSGEHLSYQVPQKPFEIFEEDFRKTAMDYLMFQKGD